MLTKSKVVRNGAQLVTRVGEWPLDKQVEGEERRRIGVRKDKQWLHYIWILYTNI